MTRQPHILLITTDQQRWDGLGLNGPSVLSTPNLDHLGTAGHNFTSAYSECPSCIPARRTLLTGKTPFNHGLVGFEPEPLGDCPTLPGELRAHGYQTILVGKKHVYPTRKRFGFDHMLLADFEQEGDYTDWLREQNIGAAGDPHLHGVSINGWVGRPTHLPEGMTHTSWCVSEAIKLIERRDPSQPLFLWLSFNAPHPPLTPPAHHFERYMNANLPDRVVGDWAKQFDEPLKGCDPDASTIALNPHAMHCCRAGYYGLITHVDDQVARLMHRMEGMGMLKDTFTLFTSDHGEMLGDHNLFRKTFAYEGSSHVPFLTRAPAWMACKPGPIDRVVGLQDVMPTLLDAGGAPIPDGVDGLSVLPLMRGDSLPWRTHLHGEHAGFYCPEDGVQFMTDGGEKYIWYTQTGEEQLFDLRSDPNETRNLAPRPEAKSMLEMWRHRMAQYLADRPEGFSQRGRLVAGRPESPVVGASSG